MSTQFTITANVSIAPELRYTPNGKAVATFHVAEGGRELDRQTNEWKDKKEHTAFMTIQAWGSLAENVAATVTKGTRVIVKGTIRGNNYEKDGKQIKSLIFIADSVGPDLSYAVASVQKKGNNAGGNAPQGQQQYAPQGQQQQYSAPQENGGWPAANNSGNTGGNAPGYQDETPF